MKYIVYLLRRIPIFLFWFSIGYMVFKWGNFINVCIALIVAICSLFLGIFFDDLINKIGESEKLKAKQKKYEEPCVRSYIKPNIYNLEKCYDKEIFKIISDRKIMNLVHFTNSKNLKSILQYGICSNLILDKGQISNYRNDRNRFDDRNDCVCLSIEFPNALYLYKNRKINESSFFIIVLDAIEILIETPNKKYFSYTNASNNNIKSNLRMLCSAKHFEDMFNYGIRVEKLKEYLPTDVQAEILFEGKIDNKYFKKFCFQTEEDLLNAIQTLPLDMYKKYEHLFCVEPNYFLQRHKIDWKERRVEEKSDRLQ